MMDQWQLAECVIPNISHAVLSLFLSVVGIFISSPAVAIAEASVFIVTTSNAIENDNNTRNSANANPTMR